MARIGITTTIPWEIPAAAGHKVIDLNNIFITDPEAQHMVEMAEDAGYPRNICGWIKGLYAEVVNNDIVDMVIAVTQGDCSNTHALMETFQLAGIETLPFAYPFDRDYDLLKLQMDKLIRHFGTTWEEVEAIRMKVRPIRQKIAELDRLTWQDNVVSGFVNHLYNVSASDFNGDIAAFEREVDAALDTARAASEFTEDVRLAYIGVPPIMPRLYDYVERMGARIVFNEIQRQFAMPDFVEDIVEQYRRYTYPYGVFARLEDIRREIDKRNIDGVIHYVQSFCFRQIDDMIFREKLDVPILTIEGDTPGQVDARTRLRLDGFIEMLR